MCRIAGYWLAQPNQAWPSTALETMTQVLHRGGPDHQGLHQTKTWGLGHRRLAIIDLSESGQQPLGGNAGHLLFNGEIYNYKEIYQELQSQGIRFELRGDTQVLYQALAHWGLEASLSRLRGMFAFAWYDYQTESLNLVRDRLGVKPLYWLYQDGILLFASELKALMSQKFWSRSFDEEAINLYLIQGYIPAPRSIFKAVRKLEGGTYLTISNKSNQQVEIKSYWNIWDLYTQPLTLGPSFEERMEQVEASLREACLLRTVADVPIAAFLSGGIDSSLVVAMLRKYGSQDLRTFTIGIADPIYDEAGYARKVAQHFETQHEELYCTEQDFLSLLPDLPLAFDEPMGDSSAIPTLMVSRLASASVKVSLSADGGDELFGGYTKYEMTARFSKRWQHWPWALRRMFSAGLGLLPLGLLERWGEKLPVIRGYRHFSNKIPKLRQALLAKDKAEFFDLASTYTNKTSLARLRPAAGLWPPRLGLRAEPRADYLLSWLGATDALSYLEGDILTKVDRSTMYYGLEGRDPLLDQNLLHLALSLPDSDKLREGKGKYVLRQILAKHLPSNLLERPKQGFSIPVETWLRGHLAQDLRAMAQDNAFVSAFGLDSKLLAQLVADYLRGAGPHPQWLWFMYCLHRWWLQWLA